MNKKLVFLALVFSVLVVFNALPALAGYGQSRQSFSLSHKEYPFFELGEGSHAGPKWTAGMDYPIQKTYHGRNNIHTSPVWGIVMKIGGTSITSIISISSGCDFEINWKTMMVVHKATETVTFSDGTIVLSIIERIDYSTMESEGSIIGFGTGNYEDVKITGKTSSGIVGFDIIEGNPVPILQINHIGTIMGWP